MFRILLIFAFVKIELKNSFNITDFSQSSVVIAPFPSIMGATLCLVRDFDLAYKKNDFRSCFMFSPIFLSIFSFDLLASLVNIFNAFL